MQTNWKRLYTATCVTGLLGLASNAHAITITPTSADAAGALTLTNAIIGTGITLVGAPTLVGVTNQQGIYSDGLAEIGFTPGIVLSSGNVNDIAGPNDNGPETLGGGGTLDDDINTTLGTAGDADLTAIAGADTQDANVLEFSFKFGDGTVGGDLFFNFVFASEEYVDFIGSSFNDAFAFILDGTTNLAIVGGSPITINNINNTSNSGSYINNVDNTNSIPNAGLNISFDGLTTVLTASATGLSAGTHTIKLAVADTLDGQLDAAIFIQGGTFSSTQTPTNNIPEPGTLAVFGLGLIGMGWMRRRRAA